MFLSFCPCFMALCLLSSLPAIHVCLSYPGKHRTVWRLHRWSAGFVHVKWISPFWSHCCQTNEKSSLLSTKRESLPWKIPTGITPKSQTLLFLWGHFPMFFWESYLFSVAEVQQLSSPCWSVLRLKYIKPVRYSGTSGVRSELKLQ